MMIINGLKRTPKEYAKELIDEVEITHVEVQPIYEQVQFRDEILQRICAFEVSIKGTKKI